MPNTPRTLSECIEAEREAVTVLATELQLGEAIHIKPARAEYAEARAATDEAVREVEGLVEAITMDAIMALRDGHDMLPDRCDNECDASQLLRALREFITSAPTAQGDTTGGASDEC